jgi:hypothetical protein
MFTILLATITMALLVFLAAARRCFGFVAKLMLLVIITWLVNSLVAYCFQAVWVC